MNVWSLRRWQWLGLAGAVVQAMGCSLLQGPERFRSVMATSIFDATEEDLAHAQAKITYLGEQDKPILTVVIAPPGHVVSMDMFLQVQAAPQAYDNDTLDQIERVEVTPAEFRAALGAIKAIVTANGAAGGPDFLSFCTVVESNEGVVGEEFRIGPDAAPGFYDAWTAALDSDNKAAGETLERQRRNVLGEP